MSQTPEVVAGEGALVKAAGYVQTARGDLTQLNKQMEDKILGLKGKWGGAGGDAFFILQQAWSEKQGVIVSALDQFEASLNSTSKDLTSTDDTQSVSYSQNTKGLDGI